MTTSDPQPSATTDAEGTAVPILPARDIQEILAFFERLGFTTTTYEGGGYAFLRRGGIELQYAHSPDVDPFSTAGMAFIRVRDAAGLYEDFRSADLWEPSIRGPELETEMLAAGPPGRASPGSGVQRTSPGDSRSSRSSILATTCSASASR
jgi:hypothetical protein